MIWRHLEHLVALPRDRGKEFDAKSDWSPAVTPGAHTRVPVAQTGCCRSSRGRRVGPSRCRRLPHRTRRTGRVRRDHERAMDEVPETQYAKTGNVHIAYQVVGEGPIDLVLIPEWFSHVEAAWDVAPLARTLRRLGSFSRLIMFDKGGSGLSDPVPLKELPSLEVWIDEVQAVMDEA